MPRRDYVLLSLCPPFMTVWMAKWRSVNNKWKEETTIFNVCSCFCFLGCCCCFFFRTRKSRWNGQARDVSKQYMQRKDCHLSLSFFCALRKCLLEWTSNVFNQWDAKRRLSSCFCLFLFFFAYPANVCLNAKWRFHTIYAKRKLSFRSFYFFFVFSWAPRNCLPKWPSEFF